MNKIVTVNFHGAELFGFQSGEVIYVALKPIVEALGLTWGSQYNRLQRDPILSKGIFIMKIPFGVGGPQQYVCLKLKLINGWLFKIDTSRVKDEETRNKILTYQEECYDVLYRYFSGERERLLEEKYNHESMALRKVDQARLIWGNSAAAQVWHAEGLTYVPAMVDAARQYDLFEPRQAIADSRSELEAIGKAS